MQIDSVFGGKIEMRSVIVTALDHFYFACNTNPKPDTKVKNLSTWHMALEGLTDKAIEAGFKTAVKENIKKMPFPGEFRKFCIIPPGSNTTKIDIGPEQTEETKAYGRKKLAEIIANLSKNKTNEAL